MDIIGIVAEYNPFHLGHLHQLDSTKQQFSENAPVVAVMSGDFVQRGADVEHYLEQDIRMDMEEFYKLDAAVFGDYIKVGKKADSIVTLLKYLKR